MPAPATYDLPADLDAEALGTALAAAGFEVAPPETVARTVLDTFDGRLHRAGLRLVVHPEGGTRLVLHDGGRAPAVLPVTELPRRVGDLPVGPFRSRLAPVMDVRALLPQLSFTARRTVATQRDAEDKLRLTVEVYEDLEVEGAADAGSPAVAEVVGLAGYEGAAHKAGERLEGLGLTAGDDLVERVARAAGIDLGGFVGSPTVPLDPDLPALEAYRQVLANLAATVEANRQGTIDDVDPEFLHDLRVAVRRARSVLSQGRRVVPAEVRDHLGAELRWLGTATGPARDLDVQLLEWDAYVAPLGPVAPALAPVLTHLEAQRRATYVTLGKALRSRRHRALVAAWHRWLDDPTAGGGAGRDAARPAGEVVTARVTAAHDRLVDNGRAIDDGSPAEALHDLRKDAKKLRYLLECFGGMFDPGARKAFVSRLKALQDNLGEHQDAEVHAAQLEVIAGELHGPDRQTSPDTILAMGRLIAHLEQRQHATRAEFGDRFADFDTPKTRRALDELLASAGSAS